MRSRNSPTQVKESLLNSLKSQELLLINKEEELRLKWFEVSQNGQKPTKKLKRLRKGKDPEVHNALNDWLAALLWKK
jgi:hypothetical protein